MLGMIHFLLAGYSGGVFSDTLALQYYVINLRGRRYSICILACIPKRSKTVRSSGPNFY